LIQSVKAQSGPESVFKIVSLAHFGFTTFGLFHAVRIICVGEILAQGQAYAITTFRMTIVERARNRPPGGGL
jgi:hypothetical protein